MAETKGLVAGHGPDACIFCKIREGTIPSYKVLETEHALAFLDLYPMALGHCLLIPKKHYPFMGDIPANEAAEVFKLLPQLVQAVQMITGAEGINVVQNNGAPAGQVVYHVHFHVIPRFDGDGLVKYSKSGPKIQHKEAESVKALIVQSLGGSSNL